MGLLYAIPVFFVALLVASVFIISLKSKSLTGKQFLGVSLGLLVVAAMVLTPFLVNMSHQ